MKDIEEMKRTLNEAAYVSFDVFDTLLLRPYVRPTDLFRHMELYFKADGFSKMRIEAERKARARYRREITLDEIYDELDDSLQHLKDEEIEMEISVAIPNQDIMDLYNWLIQSGRTVVLVSDMYLPTEVIEKMLENCDIKGYRKLYVSSAYSATKHSGELYDIVPEDLGISKEDVIHIGDNRHSDYNVPMKKGIRSILCKRPIDVYFKDHKDEHRFYSRNRSLQRSIMVSMDMINESTDNIWNDIGRRFGGPLATSYSITINDSDTEALFLYASRDGYNLKRISEELYPNRRTGYVFSQRLLLDVLTDDKVPYGRIEVPNKATNRYQYEKKSVAMERILRFFQKELDITIPEDRDDVIELYNSRIDDIDVLRKKGLSDYSDYVNNMCQTDEVHLIDCTTMKYSSQKLIEKILGRKVKGHYFVTLSEDDSYDYTAMCDWRSPAIGWMNIDIPEFFLCSPEYPLSGWDNGPVFDESSEEERYRISVYDDVSDGELDYARRYKAVFGKYMIPFDYWSLVKWSKLSAARGTEYYERMKDIRWASDPDHTEYQPLITGVGSIKQIIKKIFISIISRINKE